MMNLLWIIPVTFALGCYVGSACAKASRKIDSYAEPKVFGNTQTTGLIPPVTSKPPSPPMARRASDDLHPGRPCGMSCWFPDGHRSV